MAIVARSSHHSFPVAPHLAREGEPHENCELDLFSLGVIGAQMEVQVPVRDTAASWSEPPVCPQEPLPRLWLGQVAMK